MYISIVSERFWRNNIGIHKLRYELSNNSYISIKTREYSMSVKDKEFYRMRKEALVLSFLRKGISLFEARQKAVLFLANSAIHSD